MNDLKIKYDGRHYGVVGKNNAVVVPFIYDEILRTFSSGLINVCKNDKWGCLDLEGNEIIPLSYEWIKPFGSEEECVTCAKKDGFWGVIDKHGNAVVPFTQVEEILFKEKINYFKNDQGKRIIIDNKGRLFSANDITVTRNYSKYGVAILKKDGKYGLVDRNDVSLLPFEYDSITDSQGKKCYIIEQDGKYGVASYEGILKVAPVYDGIGTGVKEAFIVITDNRYGLINWEGHVIIKPSYDFIKYIGKGCFRFKKESEWLLYKVRSGSDDTSNIATKSKLSLGEYSMVFKNASFSILRRNDGFYGVMDRYENPLTSFDLTEIRIIHSEKEYQQGSIIPHKLHVAMKKGDKWGILNEKGKCIAPFVYDDVGRFRSSWNTIEVYQNGKCGFISDNGSVKLPCNYDTLEYENGKKTSYCNITKIRLPKSNSTLVERINEITQQCSKYIAMKKDGHWGAINPISMAQVIPFEYDKIDFEVEYDKTNSFIRILKNKKYGLIYGGSFTEALSPEFDKIDFFPHLIKVKKDKLYGAFNAELKLVIPLEYENVTFRENNRVRVKKNNQWSWMYLMGSGEVSSLEQYSVVDVFNEGLALVKRNGKFGYINETMKEVIPCIYDKADAFMHGIAIVENGGKFGALNTKGELVIPFDYLILADLSMFGPTLLMAIKERLWGVINKKNQVVVPFEYDEVMTMGGIVTVTKQSKKGLYDHNGQLIVPVVYDDIQHPSMGFKSINVCKNGKWGVLNKFGKEICEPRYDRIDSYGFACGRLAVCRNNKWGFINRNGREVIECVYDEVDQFFEENHCEVKLNGEKFMIDTYGRRI